MNRSVVIRKLHRWVGLVFSVSALMASGSGILHNVMTWTQPPPPAARPAGHLAVEKIKISTQNALSKLPKDRSSIQAISIREIAGDPWYQFLVEGGKPYYVSAVTGEAPKNQDAVYAAQIASRYFGDVKVRQTDFLTGYTAEYLNIFRILPVYRFEVRDSKNTRLFVSTMTGSVTRHTDDRKQFEANSFTYIHKLGFIPHKPTRDFVLTITTSGIFIFSLLGIVLFCMTRPK